MCKDIDKRAEKAFQTCRKSQQDKTTDTRGRKNKSIIFEKLHDSERQSVMIAFIWQDGSLHESREVEDKIIKLLTRLREKL